MADGERAPRDDRARRTRLLLILGGVVLVGVALLAVALEVTARPDFCASCHEMQPVVAAWRQGSHAKFGCLECHADPGPAGYFKAHVLDGLRDVYVHVTNPPDRITKSYVPPSRCLRCHDKDFGTEKLPPDHPPKTAYCPECHRDAIHGAKP